MNELSSSPIGVVLAILLLLLVVAWILLPFTVFGLKERADKIIGELQRIRERLPPPPDQSDDGGHDGDFGPSGERLR